MKPKKRKRKVSKISLEDYMIMKHVQNHELQKMR